jgi:hypothetical protein
MHRRRAQTIAALAAGSAWAAAAAAACGGGEFRATGLADAGGDALAPPPDGPTDAPPFPSDSGDASRACDAALLTDPLNCGACGRDCLGGVCDAGACAPVAFVTGENATFGVAVQGGVVYWTTAGAIRAMPANRSTQPTTLVSGLAEPAYLVVTPAGMAVPLRAGGTIETFALDGGARNTIVRNENMPLAVTFFQTLPIWANENELTTLKALLPDGGKVFLPGPAVNDPEGLDMDPNGTLYLTEFAGSSLKARNVFDGGTRTIASGAGSLSGIAVRDGEAFFASHSAGTINVVPIGGGAVRVLARNQATPLGVAVAADAVYWATADRIMRVAR